MSNPNLQAAVTATAPQLASPAALAAALGAAMTEFQISTPQARAMFVAQLAHESGGFAHMVENLHYSPARLCAVWPARFPTLQDATRYAHDPEALANKVYGDRMGNTAPGDGWRFRGRGYIQLTGRENYTRIGKRIGVDLVGNPQLLEQPITAVRAAAAFFVWQPGLLAAANAGDVRRSTQLINGGTNGLAERTRLYTQALRALV